MTYDLYWHIPGRVLVAEPNNTLTLEEIANINTLANDMLNAGQRPVHIILYLNQLEHFPTNPKALIDNAGWLKHPAVGWITAITQHQIASMMISIVTQALKVRYRKVADMEGALRFLHEVDETIPVD